MSFIPTYLLLLLCLPHTVQRALLKPIDYIVNYLPITKFLGLDDGSFRGNCALGILVLVGLLIICSFCIFAIITVLLLLKNIVVMLRNSGIEDETIC